MNISFVEIDFDESTWTSGTDVALGGGRGEGRAKGHHVSNIIRDIENRITKPGQRTPSSELTYAEKARMGKYVELGFIWELMVEAFLKPRMLSRRQCLGVVKGVELDLDGIALNPDGFCIPDMTLEEYKATWRSSNRGDPAVFAEPENFWSWILQTQAYCAGYSKYYCQPVTSVRMFVFFVNGDYKASGPICRQYNIKYTAKEVAETWIMLRDHAKRMK